MNNLDQRIAMYVKHGYHVTERTEHSAQLVKPKKFSFFWATAWFLCFGVGILVYLFYYWSKRDQVVYLQDNSPSVAKSKGGTGVSLGKLLAVCVALLTLLGCSGLFLVTIALAIS